MAAPALVGLSHAQGDKRVVSCVDDLLAHVRTQRPDLKIDRAYTCGSAPRWDTVLNRLARSGHEEIVIVPLELTETRDMVDALSTALASAHSRHPHIRVRVAEPLGLQATFLSVLDERVRAALRAHRALELDALVLAGAGSADPLVNQSIARLARVWSQRHKLPVSAAYASSAPPATGEAVRAFRSEGRRHIAVASMFLTPGPLWDRASELAYEAGAIAVSEPLGAHPEVSRAVLARYAVGAVELVDV